MADAGIVSRLNGLGITGTRATNLANSMSATQVNSASDQLLLLMVAGRESGAAITVDPLYPDGHLYPS